MKVWYVHSNGKQLLLYTAAGSIVLFKINISRKILSLWQWQTKVEIHMSNEIYIWHIEVCNFNIIKRSCDNFSIKCLMFLLNQTSFINWFSYVFIYKPQNCYLRLLFKPQKDISGQCSFLGIFLLFSAEFSLGKSSQDFIAKVRINWTQITFESSADNSSIYAWILKFRITWDPTLSYFFNKYKGKWIIKLEQQNFYIVLCNLNWTGIKMKNCICISTWLLSHLHNHFLVFDLLERLTVPAGSDHYFRTYLTNVCPHTLFKISQNKNIVWK